MARKKSSKPGQESPVFAGPPATLPLYPLLTAREARVIAEHIERQGFASFDEAGEYLAELIASGEFDNIVRAAPMTEQDRAMNLVYRAWEEPSLKRRIKLSQQALEIDPDCIEAYINLAEDSLRNPDRAEAYCRQALKAGKRVIGPENLAAFEGWLWDMSLEGRQYLIAMLELAKLLWSRGKYDEAREQGRELLRLDTRDAQGFRYTMVSWLIIGGLDSEARNVLKWYRDDIRSDWHYSNALLEFRKKPSCRAARRALQRAVHANPFIGMALLDMYPMPPEPPPVVHPGGPGEAFHYMLGGFEAWTATPGAIDWLADTIYASFDGIVQQVLDDAM